MFRIQRLPLKTSKMAKPVYDNDRGLIQGTVLEAVIDVWAQAGGRSFVAITGTSMFPLLREGDSVLVAHGREDVKCGDIIVFRHNNRLFAHRVLRIIAGERENSFVTKGDNVLQFDPPFESGDVLGKVLAIKRGNRQMSIDTTAWRLTGWFIAVSTLILVRLFGWVRYFTHKPSKSCVHCLTDIFLRGRRISFLLIRKVVFAFLCRWKA